MRVVDYSIRVWASHHIVIASMSSEETCSQGFLNDDIFEVIVFAVANESRRLALKRTITVEECVAWQSSVAKYEILHNLRLRRNITNERAKARFFRYIQFDFSCD